MRKMTEVRKQCAEGTSSRFAMFRLFLHREPGSTGLLIKTASAAHSCPGGAVPRRLKRERNVLWPLKRETAVREHRC